LALLCAAPLAAEQVSSIAAVVNGKAITRSMLESRLELVFSSSNIPDNAETRKRFTNQVLDNLIDEALQQQEAQQASVAVTADDMTRAIADLEQRNKMEKGSFEKSLTERGVNKEQALAQIRSRLLWQKVALKKLRARVTVSEAELQEGLDQFAAKQNRREFYLSEIVLPILDNSKREDIRALANRIVSEVRGGAEFGVFARQFSISGTALQGGDSGWVPEERIEKESLPALLNTAEGQVTDPIETAVGIKIYKVNKRYDPKDVELTLKQFALHAPYPAEAPQQFIVAGKLLKGCENIEDVKTGLKEALPEATAEALSILDLGTIKLSDLASDFRATVSVLASGEVSQPIASASSLNMFVVCERSASSNTLPDPEKVRDIISREKLDLESRRYLNQLRRTAFIEKR
jgi:peptidyl-prolyl cis-trans isomerase SurA